MRRFGLLLACFLVMASIVEAGSKHVHLRGSLDNSRLRFEREKKGHVAFIGGSITEMNGYRPMVCDDLKKRFPETDFTFTDAGISSTCSTTGAFRLSHDVLSKGPVDLFFIEFAVNDDQDAAHTRDECIRGMEGLVRHCWKHNPNTDIVVTYFVNEGMLATLQKGETPLSMGAHDEVLKHYGVSTSHLAAEVADQISAGTLTWQKYGGVHPAPFGNRIAADMIQELCTAAWSKPLATNAIAHQLPQKVLDPLNYERGHFADPGTASLGSGWLFVEPDWDRIPGSKRPKFLKIPMLCADTAGSETTFKFDGQAIGAFIVAGPDAGIVEASVDGDDFTSHDLYHRFSSGLHYPRTVMLRVDLKPGPHTLRLRISKDHNSASKGFAARIMQFAVN